MANTTADKLAKLSSTKAALKSAINGSGSTVGDVFSEYPTAIISGKSAIAQAITGKGVETAADATFQQIADNVEVIPTGGSVEINYDSPETYSGAYTYTENDAIIVAEGTMKGATGYVHLNFITMDYLVRDNSIYQQDDNLTLTPYQIPKTGSLSITFDGAKQIAEINIDTKTISATTIKVYKLR